MSVWKSKTIKNACILLCTGAKDRCGFYGSFAVEPVCERKYKGVYSLPVVDSFSIGAGSKAHEDMILQRYLPGMYVADTSDGFSCGDGSVAVWANNTWIYIT